MFFKDSKRILEIFSLSKQAFGQFKLQIIILTILGFVSGMLGGIGINSIIPLFSFIVGNGEAGNDIISKSIQKLFIFLGIGFTLKYLFIFIVLIFILKAAVLLLFSYVNVRINSDYEEKTRSRLFKLTMEANWSYLLKQKLGHLEKILMVNVQNSRGLLSQISINIMTLTSLIAYTIIALNISYSITLVTFGVGGMLIFIFKPLIKKVRSIAGDTEKLSRDISHHINQSITGMKMVKALDAGPQVAEIGKKYFQSVKEINIRSYIVTIFSSSMIEPISVIFIAIVFVIFYKSSNFNFAALVTVIYLIKQIFLYIIQIQEMMLGMISNVPYLKSILDYENETIKYREKVRGNKEFSFNHSIEFTGVKFFYDDKKEIISDLNFTIEKGKIIGLIGPSGAGKTTVVDLILRLFEPQEGQIMIDGVNINEINLSKWRRNIGYVSQDIFLINDTIENNIKFYDNSITQADVEEAIRKANLSEFIKGCSNGLNTIVGERGLMLSGGQRQRIIIARALVRKPKLLIFDEATSSLDNESEAKIKEVINNLKGEITVFVIAHRLSTVLDSDILIVLKDGKIMEQGRPEDLLKDKESYFFKVSHLSERL